VKIPRQAKKEGESEFAYVFHRTAEAFDEFTFRWAVGILVIRWDDSSCRFVPLDWLVNSLIHKGEAKGSVPCMPEKRFQ